MLVLLKYLAGMSDSNDDDKTKQAGTLPTIASLIVLWSVVTERPQWLYEDTKPQHTVAAEVLLQNFQQCGYYDCARVVSVPSYFDRDLMAWYAAQAAKAVAAQRTECQQQADWQAGLLELSTLVENDGQPIVLSPPCPAVPQQQ